MLHCVHKLVTNCASMQFNAFWHLFDYLCLLKTAACRRGATLKKVIQIGNLRETRRASWKKRRSAELNDNYLWFLMRDVFHTQVVMASHPSLTSKTVIIAINGNYETASIFFLAKIKSTQIKSLQLLRWLLSEPIKIHHQQLSEGFI